MNISIENRLREVEKIVSAAQARGTDPEVAAYYCKLGCVMICGTIERAVEIFIVERVGGRSSPQVNSFLKSFFKRGSNYSCDDISDLLYKFDSKWGRQFNEFVDQNEQVKSGVSSCYAVRNSIAHGGTQSLGPSTLRQYYENSLTLIAELNQLLR